MNARQKLTTALFELGFRCYWQTKGKDRDVLFTLYMKNHKGNFGMVIIMDYPDRNGFEIFSTLNNQNNVDKDIAQLQAKYGESPEPKQKKATRLTELEKLNMRLEEYNYTVEGETGEYDVFSNEVQPGAIDVFETLAEVRGYIPEIRHRYAVHQLEKVPGNTVIDSMYLDVRPGIVEPLCILTESKDQQTVLEKFEGYTINELLAEFK